MCLSLRTERALSLISLHIHLIFPTQTFLYITTLSNTCSKKKLQLLLISKVYHFYLFEKKKNPIIIDTNY